MERFDEKHLTEEYVSWLNNPVVVRFSEQRHKRHDLETCRAYWHSFQGGPHFFWAILERKGAGGHIGNINACVDTPHGVADIGILIGQTSAWGLGYGTEAWRGVCNFLFQEVNVRKVTAGTLSVNKGMIRIMEKLGMENDGRRKRHCLWEGIEVDVLYRAIFREQWLKGWAE
jgi:RimJ/RimL family protein N-acetyltransferase